MKRVMAFALAGGRSSGLSVLAQTRSVAAVPFAGKFRLIDFTLSNCVNSELYTVAVLAQYAPLSLAAYVGRGEPWDLNRRDGGVTVLQPYVRQEGARWYEGTADALRQNLDVLENSGAERVFVISADLVYKMDYSWVLEHHWASRAEATLVAGRVPYGEVSRFGMLDTDPEGRILSYVEKPDSSAWPWAFMGIYLFETAFLKEILLETRGADLIIDVLGPRLGQDERVRAYFYEGYWDDMGGIREYYRAHQRLLEDPPAPDLYDPEWRIYARSEEMVPALFEPTARVERSLFANGARVAGNVERSVISPGVHVDRDAIVRDSIILNGARICHGAVVERAVIDKDVNVGAGARVGSLADPFRITVIGKGAEIHPGAAVAPGSVVPVAISALLDLGSPDVSDVYSMVLAGGVGSRLSILTEQRAKPAVPFGGKFRIIDFVLSNLANSGYFDAALLTQYRPLSLIEHVATGRTWDLDRSLGGLQILQPYLEAETGEWYRGTADAVYRNLLQIAQRTSVADVLILSGDHVYAMDYRPLVRFHREHRFPATVAVTPLEDRDPRQFGVVETDANWQIAGFEEKPAEPRGKWASMGIYVFRRDILTRMLREDAADPDSEHDFGKNIFPRLIRVADVGAHVFEGYWQDIGTVEAFYEANMKLLDPAHIDAVARPSWPIRTPSVDAPPARVTSEGRVVRSLIANGAVVRGHVEESIIFPGVVVEEGATVRGSIVMNGCGIEAGARVERTILDKRVRVGRGATVGGNGTAPANRRVPDLLQNGLTLIGKSVIVEPEARVGRNVCLGGFARIPSGTSVEDGEYVDGALPATLRLSAGASR